MKKWLSLILCAVMLLTTLTAFGEMTALGYPVDFNEEPYEVRMVITIPASVPAKEQVDRIAEKISELTLKDLNMTLKLEILTYAQYFQTIPLELATREKLDLFVVSYEQAAQYALSGYVVDLAPLLDKYGPNIVSTYASEAVAKACSLNGFLVGMPAHKENCIQKSIIFRTDILEKYQIDPSSITDEASLNAAFATIAAGEPAMWVTTMGKDMDSLPIADHSVGVNSGVCLMGMAEQAVAENFYATEEFAAWLHMVREWNQKGWINPAAATDDQAILTFLMGQTASYLHNYAHPLTEAEIETACGFDVTLIPLSAPLSTSASSAAMNMSIATGSQAPEKAMMMLDYLMTQPAAANLLNWGVEGVDYVEKDGLLDFPEGKDATTVGYHFAQGWMIPNQFICTPWVTPGATVYSDVIAYNATAKESIALGFTFNPSNVLNELAAIGNVRSEYYNALNTGAVDPDEYLAEYLQALDDAGMQKVIDEVQSQLDAFMAAKN